MRRLFALGMALGIPLRRVLRSTRDMTRAFRQIAPAEIHARVHIVAVWHPVAKEWRFTELDGLAFGKWGGRTQV